MNTWELRRLNTAPGMFDARIDLVAPDDRRDLLHMGSNGKSYELVGGQLRERNGSMNAARIAGRISARLDRYGENLGWVFGATAGFQCFGHDPEQVLKPDASFVSLARFPLARFQEDGDGFLRVVPEVVAEVVAPADLAVDVVKQIEQWLNAGVGLVWEVYPGTQTIYAHRRTDRFDVLHATDTLTAPDVLPGFAVPVAELFRLPPAPATT